MIDTICIYEELSLKDYNKTYQNVNSISKERGYTLRPKKTGNKTKKIYRTTCLYEKGFLEIGFLSTMQENGFCRKAIEIKLKSKMLIDPKNYSDVTVADELEQVREKFNKIIRHINPELPDFWDWKCKRVDYAITIHSQYVEEYIELFKMGNVWDIFKEKADNFYNCKGSLYLISESNDVVINFYDKYQQLIDIEYSLGEEEYYEQAENKLRLEVQCMGQKIRNLKAKYNLNSTTVKDLLQPHIAKDIIEYYYIMVADKQDYYSFKKAIKVLKDNKKILKYPLKEYILVLLSIKSHGSIWKTLSNSSLGKNAFEKRIREIKKTGINPVIIPDECDYRYLPNLFTQIIIG